MDRQPWFGRLTADQRAGVLLVTQSGVANFVAWLGEPAETIRLTAEAFRIAPHDLARRLSCARPSSWCASPPTCSSEHLPPLAADEDERRALVEGVLRFGREIAFAAATVYAGAAETRGAWDARLEALVVDAVVRGPRRDQRPRWRRRRAGLPRRRTGLGPGRPGARGRRRGARPRRPAEQLAELRRQGGPGRPLGAGRGAGHPAGRRAGRAGRTGRRPATGDAGRPRRRSAPARSWSARRPPDLAGAHASARDALAGLRAAPGRPDAPRPVAADDLLPERALAGDPAAHRRLVDSAVAPLVAAGGELLRTLAVYLEGGGALEACARALFVHPNTVRYRLRRVGEITGHSPTDPRDAFVLRTAARRPARLQDWTKPPNDDG